ncbi:MAG: PD-(D/E)XK nuclease family protein [Dehalococcoidia bacterium]|jgi:hypothetical protein
MKTKTKMATVLKKSSKKPMVKAKKPREPLWKGPAVDGITQSMLSRFIVDRERFRLLVIEGLAPPQTFNHRLEYGSMWHVCEEYHGRDEDWNAPLRAYAKGLCQKYPMQQEQVVHWMRVCALQFPVYVEYWRKHKDVMQRKPVSQEEVFNVPYELPSGRVVRLRGKRDSVDRVKGRLWLQENKTKGDVDEQQMQRQLLFDLQTMLYVIALQTEMHEPVCGIRYNVVRRPLAGGKYSITQHKGRKTKKGIVGAETRDQFYERLQSTIAADPSFFFMRWNVDLTPTDVGKFELQCLIPLLEQICDWWEWMQANPGDPYGVNTSGDGRMYDGYAIHWRLPYGVYNVLLEGGSTEYDEYLSNGSTVGLSRDVTLFSELEE